MNDNEVCDCLKGKNCCNCGMLLEKDELIPGSNPFAADVWNDHSKHLLCHKCVIMLVEEI